MLPILVRRTLNARAARPLWPPLVARGLSAASAPPEPAASARAAPSPASPTLSPESPVRSPPAGLQSPNEAWFYYNRLFLPAGAVNRFAPASFFTPTTESLLDAFRRHHKDAEVLEVIPRASEGGAFVRVRGDRDEMRATAAAGFRRRWLLLPHHTRGYEVRGRPWVTDIPRALSRKVCVTPRLPDEECYELLRPYGRIIAVENGEVRFFAMQDAITATFCAHRSAATDAVTGAPTTVRLALMERPSAVGRVRAWASAHPRVVIPLVFAFLFAMAYAVFEPVREFCIAMKIRGTLSSVGHYVEWARQSSQRLIGGGDDAESADECGHSNRGVAPQGWNNTASSAELLKEYIDEGAFTFIVVTGPKGSGKSDIVEAAMEACNPYVLDIDCGKLKAAGDEELLGHLATALGYWPVFLWTNRLLRTAELGIQGLTGQTAGITETTDQQARRILATASRAIRRVALRNLPSELVSESVYLETHPQELPVIVLRGLAGCTEGCVALMAEWAGDLIKHQIARVIVVTEEAAFDKRLSAALPNRVFRVVRVEDAAPAAAKEYVMRRFVRQAATPAARAAVSEFASLPADFLEPLGGRFTDLQSFGRRLLNGESPHHAMKSLVHAAALEASQLFLTEGHPWTVEQAWTLVRCLANSHGEAYLSVPGTVAAMPAFAGADVEAALEALEHSGLVTLRSTGGRVTGVKPSRPLYRAAFSELCEDPLVASIMAHRLARFELGREMAKVAAAEEELVTLAHAMAAGGLREARERQDCVAKQLSAAQANILKFQQEISRTGADLAQFQWFCPQTDTAGPYSKRSSPAAGMWSSRKEVKSRFE